MGSYKRYDDGDKAPLTIRSLLIANRGEIACRIIHTASAQGIRTIAVYSDADADALHVRLADVAVRIGESLASGSYLNSQALIEAAREAGADAIHPGYGFLSENGEFAAAVIDAGLLFVGPPVDAINIMGNKAAAKKRMLESSVPCVPGYEGAQQTDAAMLAAANNIGFPLMVKAAAGGGGRGMRLVRSAEQLPDALASARSEALNAFASDELILERAVIDPRHVEIQVFADQHGNCIHLGERDCSVQRRHQKVIEEAPCPVMTTALRAKMGEAAIAAARAVDYCGAGTVEFLLDDESKYYFLEMNTRLQVEHPVTEMITGLDLVALQLAVACGQPLSVRQEDVQLNGHAIEVRLYAEDPANDFLPGSGYVHEWRAPPSSLCRTDSGIDSGSVITPFYDPMLAKLIAHGETRENARTRLLSALEQCVLLGPVTNLSFLQELLQVPEFRASQATTGFIGRHYPDGLQRDPGARELAVAAVLLLRAEQQTVVSKAQSPTSQLLGWSSAQLPPVPLLLAFGQQRYALTACVNADKWTFTVDDQRIEIKVPDPLLIQVNHVEEPSRLLQDTNAARQRVSQPTAMIVDGDRIDACSAVLDDNGIVIAINARQWGGHWHFRRLGSVVAEPVRDNDGSVRSPMPGQLLELHARVNQQVDKGAVLAVVEAMKMQHRVTAPVAGVVRESPCRAGQQLSSSQLIVLIEPLTEP